MGIGNEQSRLFATIAREMDQIVRRELSAGWLGPDTGRSLGPRLRDLRKMDQTGPSIGGRFQRLKRLVLRAIRPAIAHQSRINQSLVDSLALFHAEMLQLAQSVHEMSDSVTDRIDRHLDTLWGNTRAEQQRSNAARANVSKGTIRRGNSVVVGNTPCRLGTRIHVDLAEGPNVDVLAPPR